MRAGAAIGDSYRRWQQSFGAGNAVLYFGWGITILMTHIGAVIFSVLPAQVLWSLARRKSWTMQFARRTTKPGTCEHTDLRLSEHDSHDAVGGQSGGQRRSRAPAC